MTYINGIYYLGFVMNDKDFEKLQKDNIKSREGLLNLFPEHRSEIEAALIEKEKAYGLLLGAASIILPGERFCLVEKYESSYVINFESGEDKTTVRLSYEGFFAFGLLWNGFRTDEDSKRFFDLIEEMEKTDEKKKLITNPQKK